MKQSIRLDAVLVSLLALLTWSGSALAQCTTATAATPSVPSGDAPWIEDSLPAGTSVTTGTLTWDTSQAAAGAQSFPLSGAGRQTLRIDYFNQFVKIGAKAVLYVLIDECSTTRQIKVTYATGNRKVAVYWGEKLIPQGAEAVYLSRGALPAAGTWARLEIPAAFPLRIEGQSLQWLQVETYDGRVWFDHIGTDGNGCTPTVGSLPSIPSGDRVWIDDGVPSGATLLNGDWDPTQKAEGTQSITYPYFGQSVIGTWRAIDISEAVNTGETLVAYALLNDCVPVRELKITWYTSSTSKSVYWGEALLGGESNAIFMGSSLPTQGVWNRLEVPAFDLGLEGTTVTSVKFEWYAGQVWADHVGVEP